MEPEDLPMALCHKRDNGTARWDRPGGLATSRPSLPISGVTRQPV